MSVKNLHFVIRPANKLNKEDCNCNKFVVYAHLPHITFTMKTNIKKHYNYRYIFMIMLT